MCHLVSSSKQQNTKCHFVRTPGKRRPLPLEVLSMEHNPLSQRNRSSAGPFETLLPTSTTSVIFLFCPADNSLPPLSSGWQTGVAICALNGSPFSSAFARLSASDTTWAGKFARRATWIPKLLSHEPLVTCKKRQRYTYEGHPKFGCDLFTLKIRIALAVMSLLLSLKYAEVTKLC